MNKGREEVQLLWRSKSKGKGLDIYLGVSLRQIGTLSAHKLDMEGFPIQYMCW